MANDRETVVIEDCAQAYRYVKEYRKDNQDGILCGFPVFDWRIGKDRQEEMKHDRF